MNAKSTAPTSNTLGPLGLLFTRDALFLPAVTVAIAGTASTIIAPPQWVSRLPFAAKTVVSGEGIVREAQLAEAISAKGITQNALEEASKENEVATREAADAKRQVAALNEALAALREASVDPDKIETLESEVRRLEIDLETVSREASEQEDELSKTRDALADAQSRVDTLSAETADMQSTAQAQIAASDARRSELGQLNAKLATANSERDERGLALDALRETHRRTTEQLAQAQGRAGALTKEILALRAARQTENVARANDDALEVEVARLKQSLEDASTRASRQQSELATARDALVTAERQIETSSIEAVQIKADQVRQLETSDAQNAVLRNEIAQAIQARDATRSALRASQAEVDATKTEAREMTARIAILTAEVDTLRLASSETDKVKALETQVARLQLSVKDATGSASAQNRQLKTIREALNSANRRVAELTAEGVSLKTETQRQTELNDAQTETLRKELNTMGSELQRARDALERAKATDEASQSRITALSLGESGALARVDAARQTNNQLRADLEAARSSLQETRVTLALRESKLEDNQARARALRAELEAARRSVAESGNLSNRLQSSLSEARAREKDIAARVEELTSASTANSGVRRELDTANENIALLQTRNRELHANTEQVRAQSAQHVDVLVQERDAATQRVAQALASIEDARSKAEHDAEHISALEMQTAQSARQLETEQRAKAKLEADYAVLAGKLTDLEHTLDEAASGKADVAAALQAAQTARVSLETALSEQKKASASARMQSAEALRAAVAAAREDAEQRIGVLQTTHAAALLTAAGRNNAQAEALGSEILRLLGLLERVEKKSVEKQGVIDAFSTENDKDNNATLERDMRRYRSEFFAKLSGVLDDREDVRVVGDRFVFQAEVLFSSGSSTIEVNGRQQLEKMATALRALSATIPPDVAWILRVDGHTDSNPIRTNAFASNWELSAARAIAVVRFLIEHDVPPSRLSANGFGEYHPLEEGADVAALRRNRRIELTLTRR